MKNVEKRIEMFRIIGKMTTLTENDINELKNNEECLKIEVVDNRYLFTVKDERSGNGMAQYLSNKEI